MRYKLSKEADQDLVAIYIEGVRKFGIDQADKYLDELEDVFRLLAEHPKLARLREEITPPVRIHPFKRHIIVIEITDDGIIILAVRHMSENWIANPKA